MVSSAYEYASAHPGWPQHCQMIASAIANGCPDGENDGTSYEAGSWVAIHEATRNRNAVSWLAAA